MRAARERNAAPDAALWRADRASPRAVSVRIERFVLGPVVEGEPIDVVDEGFRRRVLGEDQRVIVELDMIIGEDLRHCGLAHDRNAVDQRAGLDEGSSTRDGVIG